MAFNVEDGTGIADANSYASVAYADTYFTERTIITWTGTTAQKQAALLLATDYVDSFEFKGAPLTDSQALSFPRDCFTDIPVNLRKATCEYAVVALSGSLQANDLTAGGGLTLVSDESRIGTLMERKQYVVTGRTRNRYPKADGLLKPFLQYTNQVVH